MPSSFPWNPSSHGGRSLAELLEEEQEPFLLEVYLMENGCSRKMIKSQSKPFFWLLNLCKRLRIRMSSHGATAAVFLKSTTLAKFICSNPSNIEHRTTLSFSGCFSEESKHQISPVSVLELRSAECTPFQNHFKNECRSRSRMDPALNKVYVTFEVVHENSKPQNYAEKTNKFGKERIRNGPALDCNIRETKEKMIKKTMNELILPWERHKGDENIFSLYFSFWKEEWDKFKAPQVRKIGLLVETAIFNDLREEAILDMLVLR